MQHAEKNNITTLPDEILWDIFQEMSIMWRLECAPKVCKAWARVVRNKCLCIEDEKAELSDGHLRSVSHLHTLKTCLSSSGLSCVGLASLSALTTLKIQQLPTAGRDSIYALTGLHNLTNLSACGPYIILASRLTNLTTLDLSYNNMVTTETITQFTRLRTLNISVCVNVNVRCVSTLTRLRSLNVQLIGMTDEMLWNLTKLTSLYLMWTNKVTACSMERLTRLSELTLNHAGQQITTRCLLGLHMLTQLCIIGHDTNRDYSQLIKPGCMIKLRPKRDFVYLQ